MAKLESALRIGGDGLVLYPTKICSLHSPCVESSLTERSKFVRILGCVFFFPPFSFFFFDVHEDKRKRHRSPPSFREKDV